MTKKLSLLEKVSPLRNRLHDSEWRRDGMLLLCGKFTALGLLLLGAILLDPGKMGRGVFAADPALKGHDIVNPINTVWTLVVEGAGRCSTHEKDRRRKDLHL